MNKPPVAASVIICLGLLFALGAAFDGTATSGVRGSSGEEIPEPSKQDDWCDESSRHWKGNDNVGVCEVRESRIAAGKPLVVDAAPNGGIQIKGWNQKDVLVLAKVEAFAESEEEAHELASKVRVETASSKLRSTGPKQTNSDENWWSVSYRIYTPAASDLDLEAFNGGIQIEGVSGNIRLETLNGSVKLRRVSGDVTGQTTNGSLAVILDGSSWKGEGLDLQTLNGSVNVSVPPGYSSSLETGTTNGRMEVAIPGRFTDRDHRHFRTEGGKGGASIRVMTTNGAVSIATNPGD
jgi:Putative adhesin